jgi:serine/threonine protein kinase
VDTRQQGLQAEEEAALKSSAAYRAPELTSVRPPVQICEKVDVWSMGCTMFSLAFGRSPFEVNNAVQRLGILNARYQYPHNNSMRECRYSDQYVQLINDMLELDPSMRYSPSHLHYIYYYLPTRLFLHCPFVLLFLISLILLPFLPSLLRHSFVTVYPLYSTQPLTLHQSPSPFR